MDLESQETIVAAVKQAESSIKAILDEAYIKLEALIRDGIAELTAAMLGWELEISPITIKLNRKV